MQDPILQIRRLKPSGGRLILGPRPGRKSKSTMAAMGLTHVCTLLSERESAPAVEPIAKELGCRWVWLPIDGGGLGILRTIDAAAMVADFAQAISNMANARVYLHCSAGIHRTGFFAALLLRLEPLELADIPKALAALRPVTARQLGCDRLALAVSLADALLRAWPSGARC